MNPLLFSLAIGALAGFLAGALMKGRAFGLIGNVVVGVLGGALGGWCVQLAGYDHSVNWVVELITATFGAALLIFVVGQFKRES